jgi:hypothetical protein
VGISLLQSVQFPQLRNSSSLLHPSLEFLLAVDVHEDVVVEIGGDPSVDDGADEESDCGGGVVVDLDVEGFGAGADQVAEVELCGERGTRKKTEKMAMASV